MMCWTSLLFLVLVLAGPILGSRNETKANGSKASCLVPHRDSGHLRQVDIWSGYEAPGEFAPETAVPPSTAIKLHCDKGYSQDNNQGSVSICFFGQNWLPPVPSCYKQVACKRFPLLPNGYVNRQGSVAFGDIRKVECDVGFEIKGPSFVTCLEDGEWSKPGSCVKPLSMRLPKFLNINEPMSSWISLQQACTMGKVDLVQFLLSRGANVNQQENGKLPIHEACRFGHLDVITLLLSKQANLSEARTSSGSLPIHIAAQHGQRNVVEFFLSRGVNIESVDYAHGWSSLHYGCRGGHVSVVQLLLNKGANPRAEANQENSMDLPIHTASFYGKTEVVKFLLDRLGLSLAYLKNNDGFLPFHRSAQGGHTDTMDYFLSIGILLATPDDNYGATVLHHATLMHKLDVVKWLIQRGADPFAKANIANNLTMPIHWASEMNFLDIVRFFVEEVDGNLSYALTSHGNMPIHVAILNENIETFEYFLRKGLDIDIMNPSRGMTSLHMVTEAKAYPLVRWLISHGANASIRAANTYSTIHYAAASGNLDVVVYLLESINENYKNLQTYDGGLYPIHVACQRGHMDIVGYFISRQGIDVNIPTGDAKSRRAPLHIASFTGNLGLVKYLVSKGANITQMTANGVMPIHEAALGSHSEVIHYFIAYLGLSVDIRSGQTQRTPLHFASLTGHLGLVRWLISFGADPFAITSEMDYSLKPVEMAAIYGKGEVVRYFITSYPSMLSSLSRQGQNSVLALL